MKRAATEARDKDAAREARKVAQKVAGLPRVRGQRRARELRGLDQSWSRLGSRLFRVVPHPVR